MKSTKLVNKKKNAETHEALLLYFELTKKLG